MTKEETWATLVASGVVEEKSSQTETGWNLHEANLSHLDLSGADLSGVDLRGADLSGANLTDANLSGAYLREAYLHEANLSRANLQESSLTLAYLAEVSLAGADLSGADLSGADLTGANLSDARLVGSILIKTDLTQANLSGACIDNATISEWVVNGVICSHIKEAKSGEQIARRFEPEAYEKKYGRMRAKGDIIPQTAGGMNMTDLQQLIEKYQRRMAELEAQLTALRHKHDILVEAARLLEEEAQVPDVSAQQLPC